MAKTELTKQAERFLWNSYIRGKMGIYGCYEVTIGLTDPWEKGGQRVDFMTYNTKGEIRCYEIKVSESDFNSNAIVSFEGHYNYYVMTRQLYYAVRRQIDHRIGVILFDEIDSLKRNPQKAKRQNVSVGTCAVLLESMLRSLHREQTKLYRIEGNEYWR